jgi:hypothetical protein
MKIVKKVRLTIVKIGDEHKAIIQVGENPEPPPRGKLVRQFFEEGDNIGNVTNELKARAKKWLRRVREWVPEERIGYVANLDPPSRYS